MKARSHTSFPFNFRGAGSGSPEARACGLRSGTGWGLASSNSLCFLLTLWGCACIVSSVGDALGHLDAVLASGHIFYKTFRSSKGQTPTLALSRPFYQLLCGTGLAAGEKGRLWVRGAGLGWMLPHRVGVGEGPFRAAPSLWGSLSQGAALSVAHRVLSPFSFPTFPALKAYQGDPPPWSSPKTPFGHSQEQVTKT